MQENSPIEIQPRSGAGTQTTLRVNISFLSRGSQYHQFLETVQKANRDVALRETLLPVDVYQQYFPPNLEQDLEVLYHTQQMGRLNLCDGRDSVYTQYLRAMFLTLGRENIVVVVDDVDGDPDVKRTQLCEKQLTLRECGKLFVFSKENLADHGISQEIVNYFNTVTPVQRTQFGRCSLCPCPCVDCGDRCAFYTHVCITSLQRWLC
eukprot:gi/632972163/ref/XP_007902525.1/ PREDICTED: uncharacterized protein LOC103185696 [Callorhinchus milii]